MRWFLYLIVFVSVSLLIFPKAFVYAEGNTLEVVGEIPAPTAELKVVGKIKPSEPEFEVIERIPAPSPTFTITPNGALPTISNPTPLSQYPVLTDPTPIDPKPILSNPTPIELPLPPSENPKFSKPIEELIALAKADLAQRLGVKIEDISVQSIVKKTWSDASLGCPEKGKYYAQVITPGYLIILEARGKTYHYHTSLNWVAVCSSPNTTDNPNNATPENQPQRINRLVTSRVNFIFIAQGLKNIFSKISPFRDR